MSNKRFPMLVLTLDALIFLVTGAIFVFTPMRLLPNLGSSMTPTACTTVTVKVADVESVSRILKEMVITSMTSAINSIFRRAKNNLCNQIDSNSMLFHNV